jgi:secondary thiamine-phosphate synthase enzyme
LLVQTIEDMNHFQIELSTDGNGDVVNLTSPLHEHLRGVAGEGVIHLFVVGSTAALTTLEFEPGLVKHDLPAMFQRLIPDDMEYRHEMTWNDDNGHSHVRAALLGPSLSIPYADGKLLTGEYQQVVLIDFDTRARRRKIICTIFN